MNANIEFRAFLKKIETRAVKKTGYLERGLQGYAVVYGVESRDMGGWREVIQRGAMKASLEKKLDVRMLYQHDNKLVMARESAGNLVLREDADGVYFEADLIDTQLNRDAVANVEARNLDAMSFGMPVASMEKRWEKDASGKRAICNITRADCVEISVVTWAAYESTTVSARCAAEFTTFMQHDAAGKTDHTGILRARHDLAQRRYRY